MAGMGILHWFLVAIALALGFAVGRNLSNRIGIA